MAAFFATDFGKIVETFLISMVPVIELRGAVPVAYAQGLSIWTAVAVSVVGNLVPVPVILFAVKKIFAWLRRVFPWLNGFVTALEKRAEKKSKALQKGAFWGLFLLVAIPLPGTGAWTGALVAAMLDMPFRQAFPAIVLGVVGAGIVVAFLTCGAGALIG